MASLKDLRVRISSVQSTQKITSAMKMVAAAKLRRAQEQAEASRPYSDRMAKMLSSVASKATATANGPKLLAGTGRDDVYCVVVATADRGLCGAFNSMIVREARRTISKLIADGKEVKILCVGKKSRDLLRRDFASHIVDSYEDIAKPRPSFDTAQKISLDVMSRFEAGEFDVCLLFFAEFKSAISQIVRQQQLIPFKVEESDSSADGAGSAEVQQIAPYEFEPEEEALLRALLPRNISVQVFRALLENNASEQGARMTAMDNATRNAGEMIGKLTLVYNRTRQAAITSELIEIISAKEAL